MFDSKSYLVSLSNEASSTGSRSTEDIELLIDLRGVFIFHHVQDMDVINHIQLLSSG